ncbi:MAG: cytochrome P450 [Sphingomonadaceae bacterium]|nr:cytochrome P450 [Sphingomonadaceae bacterium]
MAGHDELTGDNLYDDPYRVYARLRSEAPVAFFAGTHEYFVTRWADCQTVGANDRIFGPSDSELRPEARVFGMPNVLSMSGPAHAALREGIEAEVRPGRVDEYVEALARPIAVEHIQRIRQRGEADLTRELFEPISVRVVAAVLGMDDVRTDTLQGWFHAINGGLQNTVADDPRVWEKCDAAIADIDDVMRPMYDKVCASPDRSMISHVVHGGLEQGKRRSFDEIMPTIRVIILGGLQEPGHGAANAVYGLLTEPAQNAAMLADPAGLALKAYDEGLRWIAPIGVTPRVAFEDFELAGTTIPKGSSVAIVLASANRDESRWDDPDRFDMDRRKKSHASFGYRPHFCSGHYLSRAAGRIAIEEAYRRLDNLRIDPERPVNIKGWRFRGVVNLPARWDA